MSCPQTPDELLAWFCEGRNVTHDRNQLVRLLGALERPDPTPGLGSSPMTVPKLWNRIIDRGLLYLGMTIGWVTREGEFLRCGFAAHDHLVALLGMTTHEVEQLGWVRISSARCVQSRFRMSAAQRRVIKGLDLEIDPLERTLPRWVAPELSEP